MRKILILIGVMCTFLGFGQIHPTTGLRPGTAANQMLITRDTFSADRFIYKGILFDLSNDSLRLTDDIKVDLSGLTANVTAGNLMNVSSGTINLGGTATGNTTLTMGNYNLNIDRNLGNFNIYGIYGSDYGSFGTGRLNTTILHYNATHSVQSRIQPDSFFVKWAIPTTARFKLTPDTMYWSESVKLTDYGSGSNTGTETYLLASDADGNVIEVTPGSVGTNTDDQDASEVAVSPTITINGAAVDDVQEAIDSLNNNLGSGGVSGSGTDGYIPNWNGTTALENSPIFTNGTSAGIGTASPSAKLHIVGSASGTGKTFFVENSIGDDNFVIQDDGKVGIGTTNLQSVFSVGSSTPSVTTDTNNSSDTKSLILSGGGDASISRGGVINIFGNNHATNPGNVHITAGDVNGKVNFYTDPYTVPTATFFESKVGIGTASPTAELDVVGDIEISGEIILDVTNNVKIVTGSGSPESAVTAGIGSTYHRTDGGASTSFYVKESGTGNTGWVAK